MLLQINGLIKNMKKILYYSPFIPIIGIITHLFWIVFEYEIYSVNEDAPKFLLPMFLQVIYIALFTGCFFLN